MLEGFGSRIGGTSGPVLSATLSKIAGRAIWDPFIVASGFLFHNFTGPRDADSRVHGDLCQGSTIFKTAYPLTAATTLQASPRFFRSTRRSSSFRSYELKGRYLKKEEGTKLMAWLWLPSFIPALAFPLTMRQVPTSLLEAREDRTMVNPDTGRLIVVGETPNARTIYTVVSSCCLIILALLLGKNAAEP
jgi:hypothetical protein